LENPIAELRTLLNEPSAENWQSLVALFDRWPEQTALETGIEYALPHLEDWPEALRSVPEHWVWDRERDEVACSPLLILCTTFHCLRGWELGAEGTMPLTSFPGLANIRHLNLRNNRFGESDDRGAYLSCMEELLSSPMFSGLKTLDLSAGFIDDIGAKMLANALSLSELEELNLSDNKFRDEGLQELAKSPYLKNLRTLDVSLCGEWSWGERVTGVGLRSLVSESALPALEELDLSESAIDTIAAERMAYGFKHQNLRKLSLRNNGIGCMGLQAFANAELHQLKHLDLSHQELLSFDEAPNEKISDEEYYIVAQDGDLSDAWDWTGHQTMFDVTGGYLKQVKSNIEIIL